jgi:hypothetical protein
MRAKWCFSVLVVILTLFGVNQDKKHTPNQEIVVQFADTQINSDEAQGAIADVKFQLELLGANNIQVREASNGILKISYYSDSDVASIKKRLSKDNFVKLGLTDNYPDDKPVEFPSNNNSNSYNLDVYEIQTATNTGLDLEGISVLELKSENHRFFNPNVFASIVKIDEKDNIVKIAFKVHTQIAIAIDNVPYKIPEVRAGPRC